MATTRYQRIAIIGTPGSGKTTFATNLARHLGLRVHYLDRWFFVDNWVEREREEFNRIQQSFVEADQWIIDGNALNSLEMRYARADMVLYFSFPKFLCLWRVLKRRFFGQKRIQDRAHGCKECLRPKLLKYLWRFSQKAEPLLEQLKQQHPNAAFYRISSAKDLKAVRKVLLMQRQAQ